MTLPRPSPGAPASPLNRRYASSQGPAGRGSYRTGEKDSATTARASSRELSSPSATACTKRFPSSLASVGPAHTGRPVASAVNRHSSSLRAPPPTIWTAGGEMPLAEVSSSIVWRYDNAKLSRTQRTMAAGPSGGLCPVWRHQSAMRRGISPGARNTGSLGSTSGPKAGADSAISTKSVNCHRCP